jgi:hypothetical protein
VVVAAPAFAFFGAFALRGETNAVFFETPGVPTVALQFGLGQDACFKSVALVAHEYHAVFVVFAVSTPALIGAQFALRKTVAVFFQAPGLFAVAEHGFTTTLRWCELVEVEVADQCGANVVHFFLFLLVFLLRFPFFSSLSLFFFLVPFFKFFPLV